MTSKAYNFSIKQLDTAEKGTTATGTPKIKFRGELTLRGKTATRTVVAMGKSAELIAANMRKGTVHELRCVFNHAPANDDGKRGGEYLAVVDIPQPREKKAA